MYPRFYLFFMYPSYDFTYKYIKCREFTPLRPTMPDDSSVIKKTEKKNDKKESRRHRETGTSKRLYRLPKAVLQLVCEFLTFEEMFACARVCKRMAKKFHRMLTSYKHVSSFLVTALLCNLFPLFHPSSQEPN
jgi:hypothetical protein